MKVKKSLRDLLLISVAIGTMSTSVFGQAEKGTKELLFTGNVTTLFQRSSTTTVGTQVVTIPSVTFTSGSVIMGIGYYLTRQVEVSIGGNVNISGGNGTGTNVVGGLNSGFVYNFSAPGRRVVPYSAFSYFLFDASSPQQTSFLRPNGGFKYFFNKNTALDINFGWGQNVFANGPKLNIVNEQVGLIFIY
jgi:hypothetical protein